MGDNAVTVRDRWRDKAGAIVADHDAGQSIPFDVEPGDTVGLALQTAGPAEPGEYLLEVDLVQTGVARFSERGSTPWKCKVKVVAND